MTNPLAHLTAVWDRVVAACDPAARWAAFRDWCDPDRYLCSFPNDTDEEDDE